MGKGLATSQDVSRHASVCWVKGSAGTWDDTGPEPKAARESREPSCHPQSAPSLGATVNQQPLISPRH